MTLTLRIADLAAIAHTMPEHYASTRVLEKAGFTLERDDVEDGETVWLWRVARR